MNNYKNIVSISIIWTTMLFSIDSRILHQSTMAHYSVAKKDYIQAKNRYHNLFLKQHHTAVPLYAYRGYLLYLQGLGLYKEIVELAPRVEKSFENDPDILLLIAQAFAQRGSMRESTQRIIALSTRFKVHPEIIFCAAQIHLNNQDLPRALGLIDTLLNTPPHRPSDRIFTLLKSQIHMQLNQHQEAITTIQTCLELYPTFDRGWLLYAMLQEQQEALNLAITGYTTFLELTHQPNKQIEEHVLRLTLQQSLHEQRKKSLAPAHTCLDSALHKFANHEYDAALLAVDACLKKNPTHVDGRIVKIQILASMQQYTQAGTLLTEWIAESPENPIWFQLMHMVCHAGLSYDQAYTMLTKLAHTLPNNLLLAIYLAEYATRTEHYPQAVAHCTHALKLTDNAKLQAILYAHLGLLYYYQEDIHHAIATLEQGTTLSATHAPLHNLLAYCCITHTHDISQATSHCQKALALEPDNPHYWDTQACILYEQQQYAPAITLLEKALQQRPNNPHMLEHLAKNLYKQGDNQRALATLQKAETYTYAAVDKKRIQSLYHAWKQ